ncbi:MAG: HD domain-containing protein, partial [Lachnospiraceae bacterium]|nr:HD domain-containing protein [Lachnospiraceae bacterium]
ILHVIKLVLIHDLVEIDAGDTYAYDPEANKTKREREVAAAERIFNILPADQAKELRALWEEYEAEETPEARFGLALDILHPVMMNEMSDGIAWVNHNVVEDAPRERIERMRMGSEALYQVAKDIVDRAVAAGHIIPSDKYSKK